ncbi:Rxlr effector protein, partial [Globisporangium splendens]
MVLQPMSAEYAQRSSASRRGPVDSACAAMAATATTTPTAARGRKRNQRDLAPLGSSKRTHRVQPSPPSPSKQRIRTSQLLSLEAELDFFKHRAHITDPSTGLDQQVLNNVLLREMLRNQQFLIADPETRRSQMLAMMPQKLHDARRFLENRTRFMDPMRPFSETTHFETREGDTCVVKFDSIPFPGATSVKQVFDALTFYCFNLEICTAEIKGAIVVREEADPGDESVSHNRLVYPKACGVSVETNNIVFTEYTPSSSESRHDSAEGLVTTDFVDHDDVYPYRPYERIREDVTSIFMIQARRPSCASSEQTPSKDNGSDEENQPVVVLTRWVQAKLHHCEQLSLPDDILSESSKLAHEEDLIFLGKTYNSGIVVGRPEIDYENGDQALVRERRSDNILHAKQQIAKSALTVMHRTDKAVPDEQYSQTRKDDLKRQMESLLPTLDLGWRSDGSVGVYFGRKPEQTIHQLSEETQAFWPSFQWNDNPWIIDSQGEQYTVKTVSFLKECNLASFNVRREEERVFSVRLPTMTATLTSKRMAVLRKLVTSIILCSPEIEIDAGNQLISHQEPWSRKHTKREYKWISNGMGTIIAVPVSERSHTDYIQMQRQANGVLWTVTDWTGDATCQQDVAMIEEEIKTVGWTFKPHPLTTHCPWLVHERTPPNSIQKTIDRARTRRLHSKLYQGLGGLVDKLNEVAKTDQWHSHVQYRLPVDLWKQRGCLTPYQMWTTYRISTMQLNLFHPGKIESSAYPSNAGCGETKETISHIVWSCKRAQAAWTVFLERWIGRTLTEQALNLFLPHIASRSAPPGQRSLLRELEKHMGFITPEHSTALQRLWFIVTSSIPVLLWRTRVEIVHEQQHVTIEESTQRVWTACVMQVRAVAHRMRTLKGEKINATCLSQLLSVLERQNLSRQLEAWRLCFGGGARGNLGPGGSGWALIFLNERSNRWELKARGYAYMGPQVTNNWCEYNALKDDLGYSAHYLQHYEVKLEVFGDSQMIIAAQNGFASIRQTELQPLAVRVNQIIANFAWTSWNHTKREQNKMADLLANVAMNSKSAKILTDESRGNDQILMSQVAVLLDNDIGATPSKLRNTSLITFYISDEGGHQEGSEIPLFNVPLGTETKPDVSHKPSDQFIPVTESNRIQMLGSSHLMT